MENLQHEIMANFRRRNQTVKAWAGKRGFAASTVLATIHGRRGVEGSRGPRPNRTEEIRAALIKDGFWPVEGESIKELTGPHRH